MKGFYAFLVLLLVSTTIIDAQFISKDNYTGAYIDPGTWENKYPTRTDGVVNQSLTINGTVNRTGNISIQRDANIYGTFNVSGNFDNNYRTLVIHPGAVVEVFGNLWADAQLDVREGGTLIVHGELVMRSEWSDLDGNVIVLGDAFFRNVDVGATGNLVLNGDTRYLGVFVEANGDVYNIGEGTLSDETYGDVITKSGVGGVDDLDKESSDLKDLLGDLGLISTVDEPTYFTFNNLNGTSADLSWGLNAAGDNVVVALVPDNFTGKPVDGQTYDATTNNSIPVGGTVIFVGDDSALPFTYNGFTEGVNNYLRIWSVNASNEYSKAVELTVKALSSDDKLYESFENGASGWTLGTGAQADWTVGNLEAYAGNASAYVFDSNVAGYNPGVRTDIVLQRTQELAIPREYKSVELSFYWKCVGEPGYDGGSVIEMISGRELIPNLELAGQQGWVERVVDISDYIGQDFKLGFRWYNDGAAGQNPGLCIDEVRITGSEVARPASFNGVVVSATQVDLQWTKDAPNDQVIVAYSPYGSIGRPERGATYSVGDYLPEGGRVIYSGELSEFSHSDNFNGVLNYKIWTVNGTTYSSALPLTVKMPVALPFSDDFEGDVSSWNFNSGYENAWVRGKATFNSGSQSVYISKDNGITASYDESAPADTYLELDVDLRNYTTAELTFNWKCEGEVGRDYFDYGAVYVNDGNRDYLVGGAYYNRSSWQSATIDLTNRIGSVVTLKFRWENDDNHSDGLLGFCIDDVYITGTIEAPQSFTATNLNDVFNNLVWDKNVYGDDVIIAWSEGAIGAPEPDEMYSVGDVLPNGGGTVLYVGDATEFKHEPLKYSTLYNYKIWSVRNGIYSTGLDASANTPAKVVLLKENWDDVSIPSPLTWGNVSNTANKWVTDKSANLDGNTTNFAFISDDNANAKYSAGNTTADLNVTINLDEMHTANLSFDWLANGEYYDYYDNRIYSDCGEVWLNGHKISATGDFQGVTTWQSTTINLDDYCGKGLGEITLVFRWVNDGSVQNNPGFCIDNIEVGGIYKPTSELTNAQIINSTVSSVKNTQGDAVPVFSFDLTDRTSSYDDMTRVQQLLISKGGANNIDNWSNAIAGALLTGTGIASPGVSGVVTSSGITFTGTNMIVLDQQDVPVTYTLNIWLKPDLNIQGIADGDVFEFEVHSNNIVTGLGDDFIADQIVTSGAVAIDVAATELRFTQQPSAYATVNRKLAQPAIVGATDIHGNVDKNHATAITLSNDDGSGGSLGMTGATVTPVNGEAGFVDLVFTATGTVNLSATSGTLSTVAVSDQVVISDYCMPSNNTSERYINNVVVGEINNTSGDNGGYGDYLGMQTSFAKGESYAISIGVKNNVSRTGYCFVWIDWNGNQDFTDAGERYFIDDTRSTDVIALNGTIANVPDVAAGATRMRIQFSDQSNPASPCIDSNGEMEDYTVVVTSEGWLGQTTNWFREGNWSTGSIPVDMTDVYIPENPALGNAFPIINADAGMNNLQIARNANVTIQAGCHVTVNGEITNNGDLIIQNTTQQPASVIYEGTTPVIATIKWTYPANRYWYVGQATSELKLRDDIVSKVGSDNMLCYTYSGGKWINSELEVTLNEPLSGYVMGFGADTDISYSGELNNEVLYSKNLATGWQLLANPYPAYYDLTTSSNDFRNTTGSIYMRPNDKLAAGFGTYNINSGIGSPAAYNGIIAPNQSFWVKAVNAASPVDMKQVNRMHDTNRTGLKSGRRRDDNLLRLQLESKSNRDEAVIALRDIGSFEVSRYDSEQRIESGSAGVYVYSLKGTQKSVINVLPLSVEDHRVQLGLQVPGNVGKLKMKVTGIASFNPDLDVFLVDKQKNSKVNLREEDEYTFNVNATKVHDRFEISFEKAVSTGVEDLDKGQSGSIKVYTVNTNAVVELGDNNWNPSENNVVRIYSMNGQKVAEKQITAKRIEIPLTNNTAIYIVEVNIGHEVKRQKIVIQP